MLRWIVVSTTNVPVPYSALLGWTGLILSEFLVIELVFVAPPIGVCVQNQSCTKER